MSLSKLASWMNKTVNNNITFHSYSFYNIVHLHTMNIFYTPSFMGNNPSTICSILDSNKTCLLCAS